MRYICSKKKKTVVALSRTRERIVTQPKTTTITVMGSGAWGTALALVLARAGHSVRLWSYDAVQAADMQKSRENKDFLPGVFLPENIFCTASLAEAVQHTQLVVLVVPSNFFRQNLQILHSVLDKNVGVVWGTKGLEANTQKLFSTVAQEELGLHRNIAVLSGPSFAKDVAKKFPTAVCVAANSSEFAHKVIQYFHASHFRVYENSDFIGVQICGAMKNVIAIGAGIADGLGLGANTRAALITRGIAEMARLVKAMGGRVETVMGLAGLGDLVLTAGGESRNWRFGNALGKGMSIEQAAADIGAVIEGLQNARQFYALMLEKKIELPITENVYRVLHEGLSIKVALEKLLNREPKQDWII